MVFHRGLSDSKSPQVSRTLLSTVAVFNNDDICMVSIRLPTFKSSSPFNNPLVTVPKAAITIATIVTSMFHSFFNSLARSRYLSFFSHSFSCILWSAGTLLLFQSVVFCNHGIDYSSGYRIISWSPGVCEWKHQSQQFPIFKTWPLVIIFLFLDWH